MKCHIWQEINLGILKYFLFIFLFSRKTCAKAKLLIAKYNDETTNVDVDVNIGYYKESVEVFKQWEKSLVSLTACKYHYH